MSAPPAPPPIRASSALGWLLTVIAVGLAVLSAAVVFALDVQRTGLQARQAELMRTYLLREAESKRLVASEATAESELQQLSETYEDGKSDLTKLTEARSKREPLLAQSTELQVKVEAVIVDLLILAQSDRDAQSIISRYHIHRDMPLPERDAASPQHPTSNTPHPIPNF